MERIVTKNQLPKYDEDPTEELIEWLGENPKEWEGDESGIVLYDTFDGVEHSVHVPSGQFVCRNEMSREYWGEDAQGNRLDWIRADLGGAYGSIH